MQYYVRTPVPANSNNCNFDRSQRVILTGRKVAASELLAIY